MNYPATYWVKQVALYTAALEICTPNQVKAFSKALRSSQRELALIRRKAGVL